MTIVIITLLSVSFSAEIFFLISSHVDSIKELNWELMLAGMLAWNSCACNRKVENNCATKNIKPRKMM